MTTGSFVVLCFLMFSVKSVLVEWCRQKPDYKGMRSSKRTKTVGGGHKLLKSLKIIEKRNKFIAYGVFCRMNKN